MSIEGCVGLAMAGISIAMMVAFVVALVVAITTFRLF